MKQPFSLTRFKPFVLLLLMSPIETIGGHFEAAKAQAGHVAEEVGHIPGHVSQAASNVATKAGEMTGLSSAHKE
jgi:hypothetical protein